MDSTLIKIGEGIIGEALDTNTRGAVEVVSEGEDTEVSECKDCQNCYFSKGIDEIFREESAPLFQSVKMKKAYRNINICASIKTKIVSRNLL